MAIYIDKVMYTDKVNVDNKEDAKYVIREIQSVHDYLRAIMTVLSNYYITGHYELPIKKYEDLFALDDSVLTEILNKGVFFRGQGKDYKYIVPGIYRKISWFQNEDKLQKRIEMMAPEALVKAGNGFERLALMQHYGLRTRILDITNNALVALYFAVTDNKDEDGVVYIFKNLHEEYLTAYNDRVSIKIAVANLSFEQKTELSNLLSDYKDKHCEIREIALEKGRERYLSIVDAVYSFYQHDTGDYIRKIYADELYGMDLVLPNRLDARLLNQEGAFFLFGLEDISKANQTADDLINNDDELIRMREEVKRREMWQQAAVMAQNEDDDEIQISSLSVQIKKREREIKNNTILKSLQEEVNSQIIKSEFVYSPERELGIYDGEGNIATEGSARIKILQRHKKQLLSELKMLGINEGIVYPDFSHKSSAVNDWYQ